MKKLIFFVIVLLVVTVVLAEERQYKSIFDDDYVIVQNLSPRSTAYPVYNLSVDCPGSICMVGDDVVYNLTLFNYGERDLEIYSVWLLDAQTGENYSSYSRPNLFVDREDKLRIQLGAILGEITKPKNLSIYPCIQIALPRDDKTYRSRYGLERTVCYDSVFSFFVAECNNSLMCLLDEKCEDYDCKELNCSSCQYVQNHGCTSYECCYPDDCAYNATCIDHSCQEFTCKFYEHIENHECTVLYCENDEIYINNSCKKLNCKQDEYADNHKCRKLMCGEDETLANHTCEPLNCYADEKAINHSCIKLNCSSHEKIINHSCSTLSCNIFHYPEDHQCYLDKPFVKSFVLELGIWTTIIVLLYLIEHLYKKKHPFGKEKGIV